LSSSMIGVYQSTQKLWHRFSNNNFMNAPHCSNGINGEFLGVLTACDHICDKNVSLTISLNLQNVLMMDWSSAGNHQYTTTKNSVNPDSI
jgi:hypothetical protein